MFRLAEEWFRETHKKAQRVRMGPRAVRRRVARVFLLILRNTSLSLIHSDATQLEAAMIMADIYGECPEAQARFPQATRGAGRSSIERYFAQKLPDIIVIADVSNEDEDEFRGETARGRRIWGAVTVNKGDGDSAQQNELLLSRGLVQIFVET